MLADVAREAADVVREEAAELLAEQQQLSAAAAPVAERGFDEDYTDGDDTPEEEFDMAQAANRLAHEFAELQSGGGDAATARAWADPEILANESAANTVRVGDKEVHPHAMYEIFADVATRVGEEEIAAMTDDRPAVGSIFGMPVLLSKKSFAYDEYSGRNGGP